MAEADNLFTYGPIQEMARASKKVLAEYINNMITY